jgi:hypothetical protein
MGGAGGGGIGSVGSTGDAGAVGMVGDCEVLFRSWVMGVGLYCIGHGVAVGEPRNTRMTRKGDFARRGGNG